MEPEKNTTNTPAATSPSNQSPVISYARMTGSPSTIQFGTVPSISNPVLVNKMEPAGTAAGNVGRPSNPLHSALPPRTHSAPPEAAMSPHSTTTSSNAAKASANTATSTTTKKEVEKKTITLPVNAAPFQPSFAANPPMVMFGAPRPEGYYFPPAKFGAPVQFMPQPAVVPPAAAAAPSVPIVAAAAAPLAKKPIRIRDPNTNEDINLAPISSKPSLTTSAAIATETLPAVASPTSSTQSSQSPSVHSASSPTVRRGISIVDPRSGKPVEITKLPTKASDKEVPAPKLEESLSNLSLAQPTPQIEVSIPEVDIESMDVDEEDDEEDEEEFSGLIRPGMKIYYPPRMMAYEPPQTSQDIWRYARSFLLQFMTICTQKPDKAAEMARIAQHQQQTRRGRGGKPQKKVYSEAELEAYRQAMNRAEHAWTPVADTTRLAEEERIVREVKGILNKLTVEKFDALTKQVEDLGITSENVLADVIKVIFEKATMEPKFAEMYATFCIRIVQHEVHVLTQTKGAATAMDSVFRRKLIEKCQLEYNNKAAWTKERMELAAQGIHVKSIATGDLSEADYAMIQKKRRVLGNIRFIGELFKVKLIGPRIMHACLTEMLTNVEEPEEEEVECVCRLYGTVHHMLESSSHTLKDEGERRTFLRNMAMYLEHLGVLAKHPKLCSRVRFMVMDLLDSMKPAQPQAKPSVSVVPPSGPQTSSKLQVKPRRNEERKTSAAATEPSSQTTTTASTDSGWSTAASQRKSGDWSTSGRSERSDGWSTTNSATSRAGSNEQRGRPQSASPSPSTKVFTTSGSGKRAATPVQPVPAPVSTTPERSITPSSGSAMNRFDALEEQQQQVVSPTTAANVVMDEATEKRIKVFLSVYSGEYMLMKSIPGLLEYFNEIPSVQGKCRATELLVLQAMEKHPRFEQWREFFVPVGQQLFPLLPGEELIILLRRVFVSCAELSMDIPLMTEFCGALIALVLVPSGVEHVTPLLPWQEDEMYAVRIFAAFLKHTLSAVEVNEELVALLLRYERLVEPVAEKAPRLAEALFLRHYEKDAADLRALFASYPSAARKHLEGITRRLLSISKPVDDVVNEFVVVVSPLLDDRMQGADWQAMVRGVPDEMRPRIREMGLIPSEYF